MFFYLLVLNALSFEFCNMYRVYLGNLDEQVTEPILQKVFADHGLPVTGILIKRGYGFVDCPDQTTFDQTIDRLNGLFIRDTCKTVVTTAENSYLLVHGK